MDLRRVGVSEENLVSLYLFLASLDYLEVESLFTCPFSIDEGKTEAGKASAAILTDAVSTVGKDVSPEDIHPFAAAMVEGLSTFLPMDGRFLGAPAQRSLQETIPWRNTWAISPTGESLFSAGI